jgi:hypothetical protein
MISLKQQLADALAGALGAARCNNQKAVSQYREMADRLVEQIRQGKAA